MLCGGKEIWAAETERVADRHGESSKKIKQSGSRKRRLRSK
jgi:hypothetical protein